MFNPGNGLGIVDEINNICNTDNNSYSLVAKTRRVNQALDRFYQLVYELDKNWYFDDDANTTIPSATQDLNSGSNTYFFDSGILQLKGVYVKDPNGVYNELTQDETNLDFTLPASNSGTPTKYRLFGANIILNPVPNYNSSSGLKVVFTRRLVQFASTNTTEDPGIPLIFHPWLAQYASLPFLIEKQLSQKNDIAVSILEGEKEIKKFMANRNKTTTPKMKARVEDNK